VRPGYTVYSELFSCILHYLELLLSQIYKGGHMAELGSIEDIQEESERQLKYERKIAKIDKWGFGITMFLLGISTGMFLQYFLSH